MSALPKYDLYKDSGIERLGEIPSHWEVIRLRDVFKFGKGLSITKENLQEDGVPCVNYGEVHSKYGFEVIPEKHELKCVDISYLDRSPKALLKHGDFVFADTSEDIEGSGNFTYLNSDIATFAGYHTVVARTTNKNKRYLAYALDSLPFRSQLRQRVKGVKVYSITQGLLKQNYLWFPTEDEQECIVSFLDHKTAGIDEAIGKKEKLIDLLQEQNTILINQAVSKGLNPNAPMKNSSVEWIGVIPKHWDAERNWCLFSERNEANKDKEQLTLLTVSMNTGVGYYQDDANNINKKAENISVYQKCRKGDILYNKMRMWQGACGVAPCDGLVSPAYQVLKPHEGINSEYFSLLFRTKGYMQDVNRVSYGIVSDRNRIYWQQFKDLLSIIPPRKEQDEIVHHVEMKSAEISLLVKKTEEEIGKLKELRQVIISEVVTGKVRV